MYISVLSTSNTPVKEGTEHFVIGCYYLGLTFPVSLVTPPVYSLSLTSPFLFLFVCLSLLYLSLPGHPSFLSVCLPVSFFFIYLTPATSLSLCLSVSFVSPRPPLCPCLFCFCLSPATSLSLSLFLCLSVSCICFSSPATPLSLCLPVSLVFISP